jgi:uncharacterized membrane protein
MVPPLLWAGFGAAGLQLLLALVLLVLDAGNRANRSFALVLSLFAGWLFSVLASTGVIGDGNLWLRFSQYFEIGFPFAVLNFAAVFLRISPKIRRGAVLGALSVGAALPLGWYLVDHPGFLSRGYPIFDQLFDTSLALVTVAFVLAARRESAGPFRTSLLLVGVGFFAPAACLCVVWRGLLLVFDRTTITGVPPDILYYVLFALQVALVATTLLLVTARAADRDFRRAGFAMGAMLLGAMAAAIAIFRAFPAESSAVDTVLSLLGVWNVGGQIVVVYALVKYQLFDIDIRLKWTAQQGTVLAAFVLAFLIVSQMIQNYTSSSLGTIGGAVAAGCLLFALRPLERAAGTVVDRAFPTVQPTADYLAFKKLEAYRFAVESALDEKGFDAARPLLDRLRARLAIDERDARTIEDDLLRARSKPPARVAA